MIIETETFTKKKKKIITPIKATEHGTTESSNTPYQFEMNDCASRKKNGDSVSHYTEIADN